jgi:non-haem Fe2+, alpha-ketoglutarate-dependent halogenase
MPFDASTRTFSLTPEEYRDFHQQGYFGPFDVYEPEEMDKLWRTERLRLMDRSNAVYGEDAASGNTNISNYDRHLDSEFLADHIGRSEIVDRVAGILGEDVFCWRTEFFPKYPGDEGTDWHQADTFANASGAPQILWTGEESVHFGGTLTVWTAFTEANEATGCLQFIPGTHETMVYDETRKMYYDPNRINREVKEGVRRGFFGYDYRDLQIDPDFTPDESKAVSMVMRPGQAIMFWSTLMHASLPHNGTTDAMRMGFAARYVPTSVRIYPDTDEIVEYGGSVTLERYGAVLVSGKDDYGYNTVATETTTGHPFAR